MFSDAVRQDYHEYITQPVMDWAVYKVMSALWLIEFKVKSINRLVDAADQIVQRRHERTCDDDCAEFTRVADGSKVRRCGRMPLTSQFDCILHDLNYRNATVIRRP